MMGISHSTARWVAPASFAFDFAAQQYGMLSRPNMKDVHDANLSFFSPQPYAIALFFFPQQIAQLAWLWRLWRKDGSERDVREMVDYVPVYALGNVCIGKQQQQKKKKEKKKKEKKKKEKKKKKRTR
ncbi:hypothetical protein SLS58_001778 [Diplodia intermedia]|uniref:Uncharacterized protein n=1 Tax=Diplodia intermedia TaxID=856260 RepID=A0ABR3U0Y6_9PEZI